MIGSRPATWRDRLAEYKRLRKAGFGRWESIEFATWLVAVPIAPSTSGGYSVPPSMDWTNETNPEPIEG